MRRPGSVFGLLLVAACTGGMTGPEYPGPPPTASDVDLRLGHDLDQGGSLRLELTVTNVSARPIGLPCSAVFLENRTGGAWSAAAGHLPCLPPAGVGVLQPGESAGIEALIPHPAGAYRGGVDLTRTDGTGKITVRTDPFEVT